METEPSEHITTGGLIRMTLLTKARATSIELFFSCDGTTWLWLWLWLWLDSIALGLEPLDLTSSLLHISTSADIAKKVFLRFSLKLNILGCESGLVFLGFIYKEGRRWVVWFFASFKFICGAQSQHTILDEVWKKRNERQVCLLCALR